MAKSTVILRESIPSLGVRGSIVTVPRGYARNFLIPRGLAYPQTADNLKRIDAEKRAYVIREAQRKSELEVIAERINKIQLITIEERANEEGHLYGSVTSATIAEALLEVGYEIDSRSIKVEPQHIREVGQYEAQIDLGLGVNCSVKFKVVEEV
jgi:large subunit ribosomal protein L9